MNLGIAASAAVVLCLGTAHLVLTYAGSALHPRDSNLKQRMEGDSVHLNRTINVWRAWVGFNASHSLGLLLFGLIYGYLATTQPQFLQDSPFLRTLGLLVLMSYWILAKLYWFRSPVIGISLASALYIAGFLSLR